MFSKLNVLVVCEQLINNYIHLKLLMIPFAYAEKVTPSYDVPFQRNMNEYGYFDYPQRYPHIVLKKSFSPFHGQ